jgi:hypothetical protein
MMSGNLSRRRGLVTLALLGACGEAPAPLPREAPTAALDAVAVAAVRAESLRANEVGARPSTGLWDLDRVSERLVRAGVNPRASDTIPEVPSFLGAPTAGRFRMGRTLDLLVYLYPDSLARQRAATSLDPALGAPPGAAVPWGTDPLLIQSVNLLAILTGGSSAQRERIQLALEAGLPPAAEAGR